MKIKIGELIDFEHAGTKYYNGIVTDYVDINGIQYYKVKLKNTIYFSKV